MGHQLKIIQLFVGISLTFTTCSKEGDNDNIFASNKTANQRFKQSMEWNSLHPYHETLISSDDYFILSMADSHVGGTINLDAFFDIAKTTKASAVVMVGDLTSGQTKDYDIFERHLPPQDSLLSFIIIGNHDLWYKGWEEFYSRFGSSTYLFTIKTTVATDLFICLDSGGGTLGDKQLEWLSSLLQSSRQKYRRCLVFTHDNLFRIRHTTSTNPSVEELHVLIEIFTENIVDMVVTGHDHEPDASLFGITRYIQMDALKDGLDNAGYFKIIINNGIIDYKFEYF